jgi:hypothetical protein
MLTLPKKDKDPVLFFAVLYGVAIPDVIRLMGKTKNLKVAEQRIRDASNPYYVPPPLTLDI